MQFRQCSINGRLYIEQDSSFKPHHTLEAKLQAQKNEKERRRSSAANATVPGGVSSNGAGYISAVSSQSVANPDIQADQVDGVSVFMHIASF